MWQHHASITVDHPQGEISLQNYDPEGIPKRHWLEPSKKEIEAREKILIAAGTAGTLPPPASARAVASRLNTAEQRKLTTSALAKKFGSAGLGETQRLQTVSRARVFELPPPARNPLQTPGTRATLSSRGGMAFWMDDMQTLEVVDAPSSFPEQVEDAHIVPVVVEATPLENRMASSMQKKIPRKKSIRSTKPPPSSPPHSPPRQKDDGNALDFLERPPSTRPSSTRPASTRPPSTRPPSTLPGLNRHSNSRRGIGTASSVVSVESVVTFDIDS